jgi:hypothetical protein
MRALQAVKTLSGLIFSGQYLTYAFKKNQCHQKKKKGGCMENQVSSDEYERVNKIGVVLAFFRFLVHAST